MLNQEKVLKGIQEQVITTMAQKKHLWKKFGEKSDKKLSKITSRKQKSTTKFTGLQKSSMPQLSTSPW